MNLEPRISIELERAWERSVTYARYVRNLPRRREFMAEHAAALSRYRGELQIRSAVMSLRRVLVLTEDWCADSILNVPVVALLCEEHRLELRVGQRSAFKWLAARFPGRGGANRVPTVLFLDRDNRVGAHWSERCAGDHEWMKQFIATNPMPPLRMINDWPDSDFDRWVDRRLIAQVELHQTSGWKETLRELDAAAARGASGEDKSLIQANCPSDRGADLRGLVN